MILYCPPCYLNWRPSNHIRCSASIVIPPPDIKHLVEKVAESVARNGAEMERKLLLDRADDVKFAFLGPWHAYYPYYADCLHTARRRVASAARAQQLAAVLSERQSGACVMGSVAQTFNRVCWQD